MYIDDSFGIVFGGAIILIAILISKFAWDYKSDEAKKYRRELAIERVKREYGLTDAATYDEYEKLWNNVCDLYFTAKGEYEAAKKVSDAASEKLSALDNAWDDITEVAEVQGINTHKWRENRKKRIEEDRKKKA
jgi:hypothetical protein